MGHTAEKHRGGNLLCFRNVPVSKHFWIIGVSRFCGKFLVSQCRKTSWGNPSVFQEIFGTEKIMDKREGGLSRFFVGNFLSHSAEKIRRETLRCFRGSRVSKNFIHKGGGGGVLRFYVGIFLSHFIEKLREGPFSVSQNFRYRKIFCMRRMSRFSVKGWGVARFFIDYFMSHSTETFVGEPFIVSLISGIEKIYAQVGYITILR